MSLNQVVNKAKVFANKNSSTILTFMGVSGFISAGVMAVKATPKALSLIDDVVYDIYEEESDGEESFQDWLGVDEYNFSDRKFILSNKEIIKTTYKCYIPSIAMATASVLCLVQANKISLRRNAAIAGLYSTTAATLKDYHHKVIEKVGETKAREIKDEVKVDRVNNTPSANSEVVIIGDGNVMCFDNYSGRYFESNMQKLNDVRNEINHRLITEMWITLNDYYYEINLKPTKYGNDIGWNADNILEFDFTSMIIPENGKPCLVVDYDVAPYLDFREYSHA